MSAESTVPHPRAAARIPPPDLWILGASPGGAKRKGKNRQPAHQVLLLLQLFRGQESPGASEGHGSPGLASYSSVERRPRSGRPGTHARLGCAPRASAQADTPCDVITPRRAFAPRSVHSWRHPLRRVGVMASPNPWDPASEPNAAGLLLGQFVASGTVSQEMLNISKKTAPCFENFSRLQQITNIQAEIYQKNLEIELLKLEKDTADVAHSFYLAEKCHTLQSMNNHLEAVLKEKRSLRQRLLKPMCQENLPLEAVYHRHMVNLLELAITFIERLETHLETIRNIPHLDANLKKMSQALAKMDILVTETEELAENILKWREQQKEVSLCIPKMLAEEGHLHKHGIIVPLLPLTSKVHVRASNTK